MHLNKFNESVWSVAPITHISKFFIMIGPKIYLLIFQLDLRTLFFIAAFQN